MAPVDAGEHLRGSAEYLRGPRQMIASSPFGQENWIDIAHRFSLTLAGSDAAGMSLSRCVLEPQKSRQAGAVQVDVEQSDAPPGVRQAVAKFTATVLLPTPPLPDSTATLWRISCMRISSPLAAAETLSCTWLQPRSPPACRPLTSTSLIEYLPLPGRRQRVAHGVP